MFDKEHHQAGTNNKNSDLSTIYWLQQQTDNF